MAVPNPDSRLPGASPTSRGLTGGYPSFWAAILAAGVLAGSVAIVERYDANAAVLLVIVLLLGMLILTAVQRPQAFGAASDLLQSILGRVQS